jgi:hypothetical protein
MENITQLRDDLLKQYESIVDGSVDLKTAKEIANTAGKIISSAKVQLEYNNYVGEKTKIAFLEGN